jgi:iron complex transport system substrate-binding protein
MLAAMAAASASAQGISFIDARGKTVTLSAKASRVVSLSPAITEILYAAGAAPSMVGATTYCNYPAAANGLAKIGGFSPNTISIETIVALRPDLIVGDASAHGQLAIQLENAGLRFAALSLTAFDDIYAAIADLGRVAGDATLANNLATSLRGRVDTIRSRTATIPESRRPTVFWEVWNEPLMTAGPGTFIGMILSAAGARNVFADVRENWPVISFEAIVARNPDWIMASETHATAVTPENLAKRPGWAGLTAVRRKNIGLFDGDIVSRPGPRFVDAMEMVAKTLYPELF